MASRRATAAALAVIALAPASCPRSAAAQSRSYRVFAQAEGLAAPTVSGLAQDRRGFIWVAAASGLYRYDGVEMRRYLELTRDVIYEIAASDDGILVRFESGAVTLVDEGGGAAPLPGPDGQPIAGVRDLCEGGDGATWILLSGDRLLRRDARGWREVRPAWRSDETPARLHFDARGALVATGLGLWRLSGGEAEHLVDFERPFGAVERPGGEGWWLLGRGGKIWEWRRGGEPRLLHHLDARSVDIVRRGDWAWVALDRALIGLDASGVAAQIGRDEIVLGSHLLVDREGSLWLATFQGVVQFPEPETTVFTEEGGFPTAGSRFLDLDGDRVWITTWGSSGAIERRESGWIGETENLARGRYCRDSSGRLWSGVPQLGMVAWQAADGRWVPAAPGGGMLHSCADDGAGVWLSSRGRLWRVDHPSATPREARLPEEAGEEYALGLRDRSGRLWFDRGERKDRPSGSSSARLCSAPASSLLPDATGEPTWRCFDVPDAVTFETLVELPSGSIWGASKRLGVLEIDAGGARVLPGNAALASRNVMGLRLAADGSVWIVGHGILERVREDRVSPAGWRVEESISTWHGVPVIGGSGVLEDREGALWVASARGVLRIPPGARRSNVAPPPITLAEARAGATALSTAGSPRIPWRDRTLSLRFAALSYRDAGRLRYQVRLVPGNWSEATRRSSLEFPRLAPGSYRVEARASLDGEHWSPTPASYAFVVAAPWYRAWWAYVLWLLLAAALLWAAHRARVGVLLALERQRTRVAMDLHDEMGSGLGSIGILSGLMARDGLDPDEQRRLAREIASTSQELGGALSDIVWALRSEGATLESLAGRLAESGGRLFAGHSTAFSCRFPDQWPAQPLPLQLRRNVLLAGLEALHNAARHARASRVDLVLEARGTGWRLVVEDDGDGLPAQVQQESRGLGLRSMRRRAQEIGGTIRWEPRAAQGTRVVLEFPLAGALP